MSGFVCRPFVLPPLPAPTCAINEVELWLHAWRGLVRRTPRRRHSRLEPRRGRYGRWCTSGVLQRVESHALALALQPTKPTSPVSAVHALTQPPAVGAAPRLARSHLGTRAPKCYSSARPPRQSFRASLLPPHLTQEAPTCTLDYRAATVHGASEGMRSSPISAYLPTSMPQRCASDRVGCATV